MCVYNNIFLFFFYWLVQTEKMLCIAEEIMGPYVWGQYDLLVLPPSFPYGGMENPCLTFLTPTLLVCSQKSYCCWFIVIMFLMARLETSLLQV